MNYIVIGGAGFIGSTLVEKLVENGHNVKIIDNFSTGHIDNIKQFTELECVELFESESGKISDKVTNDEKIDGVFHLGIASSSPMYKENPSLVGIELKNFINILEFVKKHNSKLVYASTSSIYNGNPVPWKEDMGQHISDFYSEARYYMERMSELYCNLHGTKIIGLRLFSVYGSNEKHKGKYANLVSQFMWDIVAGESPVIYGNGEQRRDFVHVSDVVDAFIKSMESDVHNKIFNVGTGKSYSLNELIGILNLELGTDIVAKHIENPIKNYIKETLADTNLIEKEIGFKHTISLKDGIKDIMMKN